MIKTNKLKLVKQSVQGTIHHPLGGNYRITHEGEPIIVPATGGITYNFRIGNSAFDLVGDHVEPGVSLHHDKKLESDALMTLSCIGNEALVVSGEAKGAKGYVTGKHGGIEHVMVDFELEDMEKMSIEDKILIKAYGQGLSFENKKYQDIKLMNIDPELLNKLDIKEEKGKLTFPVVCKIPAYLMGSGIGVGSSYRGDYDIMTADVKEVKRLKIDKLKFGDFVLLENCDNTYGKGYLEGSVTVGVIVHSNCVKMGHGPGVTTIATCKKNLIDGYIDKNANLKNLLYS